MSRQLGVGCSTLSVGRFRFQSFAAPAIAEPLQDFVAPKAHFTVSLGNALGTRSPKKAPALKARLTFGLSTKRLHESRFQRLSCGASNSCGDAPRSPRRIRPVADFN